MIEGASGGTSRWLRWVDINEQYGLHIVRQLLENTAEPRVICDIGAGRGADLDTAREVWPDANLHAIDVTDTFRTDLEQRGIELHCLDLEQSGLPFEPESVDVIIDNQVFEHVKELFWLLDQIATRLKPGGVLIAGVPNIAALHNRLLFLLGRQPSQMMKSYSAHIRGFAPGELPKFLEVCSPGTFTLEQFAGAQFYPFPRGVARAFSRYMPSLAHSVFYSFRKTGDYAGDILRHPDRASLETNFKTA